MNGFFPFLMVGLLLGQRDSPSARIVGLGSGFAYLVPDTLTDMLINPANTPKTSAVIARPYPFPHAGAFCRGFGAWVRPEVYKYSFEEHQDTSFDFWYPNHSKKEEVRVEGTSFTALNLGNLGLSFRDQRPLQLGLELRGILQGIRGHCDQLG